MRLALFDEGAKEASQIIDWLSQDEAEAVVTFVDELRLLGRLGGHGCIEVSVKDGLYMEFRTMRRRKSTRCRKSLRSGGDV